MTSPARYWHTLRHLRPVQFYARVWFRLQRPRPRTGAPPPRRPQRRGAWMLPPARRASMTGPARFLLLNVVGEVRHPGDWNEPRAEKLWLYNLHYFDDLNAEGAGARSEWHRALLVRWVEENRPAQGVGWEPYPTSLRIVNWIRWALRGEVLPALCVESLAVQARWLARRLEWHLLGNHLFANAKALCFAGAFFRGPEAERWLRRGLRIVRHQLREQVLADGGHFERSPMYHALALEDVADLINLAAVFPDAVPARDAAGWRAVAARMARWLAAMCHPDGEIAFFNDAACALAPHPQALFDCAAALGGGHPEPPERAPVVWLRESGYARLSQGPAVAWLDLAPVGPDYLPGHAHADTLSFELSLFGRRVVVNGGTSCYGTGAQRLAERGTAAHSTLQIDEADSSEVWAGFRVARRARPFGVRLTQGGEGVGAAAAHDGYRRLRGRPVHRRRWLLTPGGLTVEDAVEGGWRSAVARYHLHPEVAVDVEEGGAAGRLRLAGGQQVRWRASGGAVGVRASVWHPEFGVSRDSRCLALTLSQPRARMMFQWE